MVCCGLEGAVVFLRQGRFCTEYLVCPRCGQIDFVGANVDDFDADPAEFEEPSKRPLAGAEHDLTTQGA